jgi:dihydropyrimidine dehydrogenase (NAD+) subunit PreA
MEMGLLQTQFVGIEFNNPFILAAGPLTSDASHILAGAHAGWAGAVTKTITAHPVYERNLTPSFSSVNLNRCIIGLGNNEIKTRLSLQQWCKEEIPYVKAHAPHNFVLIGSISEGPEPDHWCETATQLEAAGVDLIEMNVSCPYGKQEKLRGKYINDDPQLLESIVTACTSSVDIPVLVKLNAHCLDLVGAVKACEQGEADAISATNTLIALPFIDVYRQAPGLIGSSNYSTQMGYSGAGIRPFGLHCVSEIARHSSLPISGIGGIESWENSLEYFLVGASTVQVCTAALLYGLEIVEELITRVSQYLHERGHSNVAEIRGKALPYLCSLEEALSLSPNTQAKVDKSLCTVCEKCISPCRYGATDAISLQKGRIIIDQETCTGCGLCIVVCPFDAIRLE